MFIYQLFYVLQNNNKHILFNFLLKKIPYDTPYQDKNKFTPFLKNLRYLQRQKQPIKKMSSNPITQSFTHYFQQWTIQISLTDNFASRMQISIQSKSQPEISFKGELSDLDLSSEMENITEDMAGYLYKYLYSENLKNLKIFNFIEGESRLKIANRRDKSVICVDLEKYVGGKVQQKMNGQKRRNTKSVRISKAVMSSMKTQKAQSQQQKLIRVNQSNNPQDEGQNQQIHKEENKKLLQQEQVEQQLDYQSWLNSDDNDDQQQQQQQINIDIKNTTSNIVPTYRQHPIDRNYRFQQVNSEIYEQQQSRVLIQTQFNQFKMEQLIVENQQLKKQRVQLLERIILLEKQNSQLRKNAQNIDFSRKEKLNPTQKTYETSYKATQSILHSTPINGEDEYVYLEAKKTQSQKIIQNKNQSHQTKKLHATTIKNNHSPRKDEWIQQFQNTKRPPQQSSLFNNFDSVSGVLDISYKDFTLKQFEQHFFPFNWSCVKRLNIDGNKLGSIGFMKLANYHFPQLKEISAGYNLIKEIQSLQNFQSILLIDLRANPLSEETKFYLKKFSIIKNIQILI